MTANRRSIPRCSIRRFWARHHVADGDGGEIGAPGLVADRPVRSSRLLSGPVLPMQPPRTLGQMTKNRLVSIGRPGPTTVSHQPGLPVIGCCSASILVQVSAWQTRTALVRCGIQRAVGAECHGMLVQPMPHSSVSPSSNVTWVCKTSVWAADWSIAATA